MRKIYILLFLVLITMQFGVRAERINIPGLKVPKLIITEVRPDAQSTAYVELTNMGDTAIDLEPFTLHSVHYNTRCTEYSDSAISFNRLNSAVDNTIGKIFLKGVLQPGESFVVANVWDANNSRGTGIPNHNIAIAQIGNQFGHRDESLNQNGWINKPEWQCFGRDSVDMDPTYNAQDQFVRGEETAGYLIHWRYQTDSLSWDSTYIDQFNHFWYPDENAAAGINHNMKGYRNDPIAGVINAMNTSVMVRKANITKGNLNWNQSRGTDATTSEWLVIPKNQSKDLAFTTVGNHGVFDLDFSVKDPSKIIVDDNNLSVPWEMIRGVSLSRYFNFKEGMSWSYELVSSFEDSASYIARPGDKFSLYSVGTRVNQWNFTLRVREPKPDVALVFPKRRLLVDEEEILDEETGILDTVYTRYWSNGFVYALAEGPEIDSIINVPFATRTDSLLKYLVKPEKATWEFIFVDGNQRVDLQFGDKLKVQSNIGDTFPEFTPLKTDYIVELRYVAKQFPALQFKPQDLRAKVEVENAISIDGNLQQRTTSVTVTSESDTISNTYHFVFQKQGVPVQPNVAEPFISEFVHGITTQGWAVEIYNPGTEDLDLSRYMYVAGALSQTWQEAVETCVSDGQYTSGDGIKIYQTHYVPSKRWAADGTLAEWSAIPDEENPYVGKGFLKDDNQTDPWVKGGDVWVMGVGTSGNAQQTKIRQESDFIFRGSTADNTVFAWDSTKILHRETPIWNNPGHNMWLLKLIGEKGDSILDGTKDVRDASAYELIDRWEIIGDSLAGRAGVKGMNWNMKRKPHITKGNLDRMGGANETAESSEWEIHKTTDFDFNNNDAVANLGIHTMNPVTTYLSTVTSIVLKVTPGYQGANLTITGNITDYTAATIELVLDKADDSQTFAFMRGDTELAANETLADADRLVVTSGDGKSITNYTLVNALLDDDTSLSAKEGSGLSINGNKIMGATPGMTLKEAISNLEAGDNSIINILDANGFLQPLAVHNLDTLIYDVLVSENLIIEVIAQNNEKAWYSFDFGLASNEAILFSNILPIDQENKRIMEFPRNSTSPSMLSMLFANEGATIRILDKAGFERTTGYLNVDDIVEVTAPDGVTTVVYGFDEGMFPVSVNPIDESVSNVVIYPNPVNNILNIKGIELAAVEVYSIAGTMMISEEVSYSNRIDVSSLPRGIYVVRMTDVKGMVALDKFLKK